ncbi:MAG: DMT family transporter, partial [Spirochaetaceae bacterium]|nr:DMT family transporter [Spirochaetaceae bacterium]
SEASIITGAIPVITMAAEAFFLRRAVLKLQWLGAFVSIAGIALIFGVSIALSGSLSGYLFMAGTVICWTAYSFLTPSLFSRRSRVYIVFWQSVFGFAGFVPFALMEIPKWGTPDLTVSLHILFLGLVCSALCYCFYVKSLETLGISISALFINFVPVISVIAGIFVMGDRLSPLQWFGASLTIAGVYMASIAESSFRRPAILKAG